MATSNPIPPEIWVNNAIRLSLSTLKIIATLKVFYSFLKNQGHSVSLYFTTSNAIITE